MITRLWIVGLLGLAVATGDAAAQRAPTTWHVDRNHAACVNSTSGGTEAAPWCTVAYATTFALIPGDTVLVHGPARYGELANWNRSGTSGSPITWRAVGGRVVLGHFVDLDDAAMTPVEGMANVYALPFTFPSGRTSAGLFQTFFDPVRVADDSNPTVFNMVDSDGALQLKGAATDAALVANEGTYRYVDGRFLIHPLGNRVPSATATDVVLSYRSGMEMNASWNVFEDFTISYVGAYNSFSTRGSDNVLRRLIWEGAAIVIGGSRNRSEDLIGRHSISMGPEYKWYDSGDGMGMIVSGANHTILRTSLYHAWNAVLSAEKARDSLFDGVIMHGAPNHCGAGVTSGHGTNNIFRNWTAYNCQDYMYFSNESDLPNTAITLEHITVLGGLYIQSRNNLAVTGPIIVRNSIFSGNITFAQYGVNPPNPALCQYEASSLIENSVISGSAQVHRCATNTRHSVSDYIARCASGEFTGCITYRNNRFVTDWKTVIQDGMYTRALGDAWDTRLVKGSPAIGLAGPGSTSDVAGLPRPQGDAADAGLHEFPLGECVVSEWTAWMPGPWTENGFSTRTRQETRSRTVAEVGTNCPELTETRTVTEACTQLQTDRLEAGGFDVHCSLWTATGPLKGPAGRRSAP